MYKCCNFLIFKCYIPLYTATSDLQKGSKLHQSVENFSFAGIVALRSMGFFLAVFFLLWSKIVGTALSLSLGLCRGSFKLPGKKALSSKWSEHKTEFGFGLHLAICNPRIHRFLIIAFLGNLKSTTLLQWKFLHCFFRLFDLRLGRKWWYQNDTRLISLVTIV